MAILILMTLSLAVLLGVWLIGAVLRDVTPVALLRASHGLLAMIGAGLMAATAIQTAEPPGIALWMLGAALVAGAVLWLFWYRLRALRGGMIALHGLLGTVAYFLVADWITAAWR